MRCALAAALVALCGVAPAGLAQGVDPNAAFTNELIVVPLAGRSVAALVTHRPEDRKFTHAVAIFPGSPGYINLREEAGGVRHDQPGGFMIRARRFFLADGFLTVIIDAPNDEHGKFYHAFRDSARWGEDVKGVMDAVTKKYGALDWTFAGHSDGAVTAALAARMLQPEVKRVVFASSVVSPSQRGRGLEVADVRQLKIPVLWVHHRNDPCKFTQYFRVKSYSDETKTPLMTVTGAQGKRGEPCMAFSEHGFVGMEVKTINAIVSWIRTGDVPPDVTE